MPPASSGAGVIGPRVGLLTLAAVCAASFVLGCLVCGGLAVVGSRFPGRPPATAGPSFEKDARRREVVWAEYVKFKDSVLAEADKQLGVDSRWDADQRNREATKAVKEDHIARVRALLRERTPGFLAARGVSQAQFDGLLKEAEGRTFWPRPESRSYEPQP